MIKTKKENRIRRKIRVRKNVSGTSEKPRIFVFKSNRYLHVGVSDDTTGVVLMGGRAKRTSKEVEGLGSKLAGQLEKKKLSTAVFDRSGYKYHGLIAKFVESLRSNGIKI
ncbi:MAG TPA: 50S ribosomal protein L18 [Candidatus Dojkabacteria bacterium]|nr:50S ribosomal protein L18 [Candidatus Dojkabacteria bacterium]